MRKNLLLKTIIFALSLLGAFLLTQTLPSTGALADERCGDGYVCWDAFGSQNKTVVATSCIASEYGYCTVLGTTEGICYCSGSPNCSCSITNWICDGQPVTGESLCWCLDDSTPPTNFGSCDAGNTCTYGTPVPDYSNLQCSGVPETLTGGCCYADGTTPTPSPTDGGGGGGFPTPTPTPIYIIGGNIYEDPNAIPGGLGGTDNLCTGNTSTPISNSNATVNITRPGESKTQQVTGPTYNITVSTNNSDYTVAFDLPFPPADPDNPWQCACNADPSDPYRCLYTNQQPNQGLRNFFIKRGASTSAWFQTLGGNSWASGNIESLIPDTSCTPPTCTPALIASNPNGDLDTAGFPLSNTGAIVTSLTGGVYIHEADSRGNALQAKALGVVVPIENYDYFYDKFGDQAQILPNAGKPIVGSELAIYQYTGDLTLTENNPWNLTNTEKIIVFVDGNLTIDDTVAGENRITTVATGGDAFLMFIVSGDITITSRVGYADIYTNPAAPNVANVEGVFIADGLLTVAGVAGATDLKFIGAGTFVGWSGVDLQRNFDPGGSPELNNNAATEVFIFRPDLIVNAPRAVKSAQMTWREIEPRF